MKKLLILMLVLGMASMACAVPAFDISINGVWDPDPTAYLCYSDECILDIHVAADVSPGVNETYWVLYCQTSCGTISGGYVVDQGTYPDVYIDQDAAGGGGIPLPAGNNGVWGGIYTFGPTIPACTVLYDGIIFHCEDEQCRDVVVTLQQVTDNWELGIIFDQVTIHQVPEPASMLLLGLGGLLLRRRK